MHISDARVRLSPISLRLAHPPEFDLMARIAGLRLRHRWAGWNHEPFTATSWRHVSVYAPIAGAGGSGGIEMSDEHEVTPTPRAGCDTERVNEYLRGLEELERATLEELRRTIRDIVPAAKEEISYGLPAFRLNGTTIAGFAAYKHHLSYLPFSGRVLGQLADELAGYTMTKSSLHFPADCPLPRALVGQLISTRLAEIAGR